MKVNQKSKQNAKPKEKRNQFKLKGEKGSLLTKLKATKRTSLPIKPTAERSTDLPLNNVVEKQMVDDQPSIKLKKKLIKLSKKTVKKYDLIMSVSYKYQELDAERILELVKEACTDRLKEIDYLEDNVEYQQLRYGLIFDVKQLNKVLFKGKRCLNTFCFAKFYEFQNLPNFLPFFFKLITMIIIKLIFFIRFQTMLRSGWR